MSTRKKTAKKPVKKPTNTSKRKKTTTQSSVEKRLIDQIAISASLIDRIHTAEHETARQKASNTILRERVKGLETEYEELRKYLDVYLLRVQAAEERAREAVQKYNDIRRVFNEVQQYANSTAEG